VLYGLQFLADAVATGRGASTSLALRRRGPQKRAGGLPFRFTDRMMIVPQAAAGVERAPMQPASEPSSIDAGHGGAKSSSSCAPVRAGTGSSPLFGSDTMISAEQLEVPEDKKHGAASDAKATASGRAADFDVRTQCESEREQCQVEVVADTAGGLNCAAQVVCAESHSSCEPATAGKRQIFTVIDDTDLHAFMEGIALRSFQRQLLLAETSPLLSMHRKTVHML
jgi:hypothetical protein